MGWVFAVSGIDMFHYVYYRTFAPFWNILKTLAEKLASLHMQLVHTWSDLIKDIVRYNDDQHKRHKSVSSYIIQDLKTLVHQNISAPNH